MSSSHKLNSNKYRNEDTQGDPKLQDEDRTKARWLLILVYRVNLNVKVIFIESRISLCIVLNINTTEALEVIQQAKQQILFSAWVLWFYNVITQKEL